MRCILLAAALVAAGCLGLVADKPVAPEGDHRPWTSTTADLWIVKTTGCGFCGDDPNVSAHEGLALFDSGHVLWFRFGIGGGEERVTAAAGLSKYIPIVEHVQAASDSGRLADRHVRIHEVATSRLVDDEWAAIKDYLDAAVQEAEDPGEPNWDCLDCSGPHVELLYATGLSATLHNSEHPDYGNMEEGDPWDRILDQLALIDSWVQDTQAS